MDTRARPAGLRLFQSLNSHRKRRRLFDLSRTHRSDARGFADTVVADGMVFGMSPRARKLRATERESFRHGMATRFQSKTCWRGFLATHPTNLSLSNRKSIGARLKSSPTRPSLKSSSVASFPTPPRNGTIQLSAALF